MSKFAALSKGLGSASQGISGASSALSKGLGSASQGLQGSSTFQAAMTNASKEFNISLNYGQIGIIFLLSFAYLVIASVGINTYSKCKELEGKNVHQNLNKWLIATLAISITIPFTLVITKMSGNMLTPILMLIFAIMGIVGSATSLNWSIACEDADNSMQVYSGINVASFTCLCLISMFMMRPKSN
jgi:hypothetical protein